MMREKWSDPREHHHQHTSEQSLAHRSSPETPLQSRSSSPFYRLAPLPVRSPAMRWRLFPIQYVRRSRYASPRLAVRSPLSSRDESQDGGGFRNSFRSPP